MSDSARNNKGFSLFECIVALGIFSLVAMASMTLVTQTMQSSIRLEERLTAGFVAENIMVETRLLPRIENVEDAGEYEMGGLLFEYDRKVSDTEQGELKQIDVRVRLKGQTQIIAQLVGFVNVPEITT